MVKVKVCGMKRVAGGFVLTMSVSAAVVLSRWRAEHLAAQVRLDGQTLLSALFNANAAVAKTAVMLTAITMPVGAAFALLCCWPQVRRSWAFRRANWAVVWYRWRAHQAAVTLASRRRVFEAERVRIAAVSARRAREYQWGYGAGLSPTKTYSGHEILTAGIGLLVALATIAIGMRVPGDRWLVGGAVAIAAIALLCITVGWSMVRVNREVTK